MRSLRPPVVETPPTTEPDNPAPTEQEPEKSDKKAPNMMPGAAFGLSEHRSAPLSNISRF